MEACIPAVTSRSPTPSRLIDIYIVHRKQLTYELYYKVGWRGLPRANEPYCIIHPRGYHMQTLGHRQKTLFLARNLRYNNITPTCVRLPLLFCWLAQTCSSKRDHDHDVVAVLKTLARGAGHQIRRDLMLSQTLPRRTDTQLRRSLSNGRRPEKFNSLGGPVSKGGVPGRPDCFFFSFTKQKSAFHHRARVVGEEAGRRTGHSECHTRGIILARRYRSAVRLDSCAGICD